MNSISENAGKRVVSGICLENVHMEMNFHWHISFELVSVGGKTL